MSSRWLHFPVSAITISLWTPAELSSLALWLDAMDESRILRDANSRVSQWSDKSGNNRHVYQETGNLRPLYSSASSPAGNKPAIVYPDTDTGAKLNTTITFPLREIYFVCTYKNGLDNTFDNYDAIISCNGDQYGVPRICGSQSTDKIHVEVDGWKRADVYKNGSSESSTTILPMSLCILRGKFTQTHNWYWSIGGNRMYSSARNWKGVICEVVGFSGNLTADEAKKVEGYLTHKWGLTDKLPSDHPYKSVLPAV